MRISGKQSSASSVILWWHCITEFLTFHLFWNVSSAHKPVELHVFDPNIIDLVLLLPWTKSDNLGEKTAGGFLVALDHLYEDESYTFLERFQLKWTFINAECNDSYHLVSKIVQQFHDNQSVLIGTVCQTMCIHLVQLMTAYASPFISIGCPDRALSNRNVYPTFIRTVSHFGQWMVDLMEDILITFNWDRIVILLEEDSQNDLSLKNLKAGLSDVKVSGKYVDVQVWMTNMVAMDLLALTEKAYIVVMYESERFTLHDAMEKYNDYEVVAEGELVFIIINYIPSTESDLHLMYSDQKAAKVAKSLSQCSIFSIDTVYDSTNQEDFMAFKSGVLKKHQETRFSGLLRPQNLSQISDLSAYLYEAVMLFATLAENSFSEHQIFNASDVIAHALDIKSFQGVGKKSSFDWDAFSDKSSYQLTYYGGINFSDPVAVARYDEKGHKVQEDGRISKRAARKATINWPAGKVPRGSPKCGWDRNLCDLKLMELVGIIIGISIAIIFVTVIIGGVYLYRHGRSQAEHRDISDWIIKYEDISHITSQASSFPLYDDRSLMSASESHLGSRRMSGSYGTGSLIGSDTDSQTTVQRQIFTTIGFVEGSVVAVKKLYIDRIEENDKNLITDIQEITKLNHENLNDFVGICIKYPKVCFLMAYMQKGSLHDVLLNEKFNLTWDFRFSLTTDIVRGMIYLHNSTIGSHGHMTSSNCLVDSRWMCRITDYGMGNIKKMQKKPEDNMTKFYDMLWSAPELLRTSPEDLPMYGTKEGDVYSFGIIMQEVALRDEPYATLLATLETEVMVKRLIQLEDPPFRPNVPAMMCTEAWIELMQKCWSENTGDRPAFSSILKSMELISGRKTINVIDNMLHMLEQHAEHLEDLVKERQAQLDEEKKNVEMLLCNMLPKTIVEQLKDGERVMPELFEMTSIFFSDIVNFLDLASKSSPLQTVDLLNSVYSLFDEVTDKYEVYKVETINDEYLVASGLPVPNLNHATEIATMSLSLLSCCLTFTIPHLPTEVLKLRIGLHCGSVVGGVIGYKTPRYCVFGDTVNTASRMLTSGLALRIHASSATYEELRKTSEYHLVKRGQIDVKGKGLMNTYWVRGKKNFRLSLPDFDTIPLQSD